ncbi:MAG: intradiol ring-cleavage dioxygenase [Acidimicrobiia bacterium]
MALVNSSVSRREALGLLGAAALAAVAAACGGGSSDSAASSSRKRSTGSSGSTSGASCVLTSEMTEGPYYIDGEAVRSNITEGKPGMPLRLDLTVVDADTCQPIPGASVEVWHADATGNYSGFGSATSNRTFLRGVQIADDDGTVTFDTLYPGWYQGRAVHIHLKAHKGGNQVHTTQLFFDENVSDAVYMTSPYNSRSGQRTTNAQDNIYADGGTQSTLALAKNGDGYVGTLTLGIRTSV